MTVHDWRNLVGLYGVLYLEVARVPERGWSIAAVGFTGKVLGPIGMLGLIATGEWPLAAAVICVTNDLIWWIPFALYLRDAFPFLSLSYEQETRKPHRP